MSTNKRISARIGIYESEQLHLAGDDEKTAGFFDSAMKSMPDWGKIKPVASD